MNISLDNIPGVLIGGLITYLSTSKISKEQYNREMKIKRFENKEKTYLEAIKYLRDMCVEVQEEYKKQPYYFDDQLSDYFNMKKQMSMNCNEQIDREVSTNRKTDISLLDAKLQLYGSYEINKKFQEVSVAISNPLINGDFSDISGDNKLQEFIKLLKLDLDKDIE